MTGPTEASRLVLPELAAAPEQRADLVPALSGAAVLVVLDDDPTGTQTVRDVPVLTRWRPEDVHWALTQPGPGFFILTNTRALVGEDAAVRVREVVATCRAAARKVGVELVFASRSDSTLRGHFPLETDVLRTMAPAGRPVDAVVLVPAYLDAGRVTVDSVHWVVDDGVARPVGETEYAADATFGFRESRLPGWVEEKTRGQVAATSVLTLSLDTIRRGGPSAVEQVLRSARGGRVVAVDAQRDDDLRTVAAGALAAESAGHGLVYRTGPSFVRARLGQEAAAPLDDDTLDRLVEGSAGHGLIVVGSHVPRTTRQLTVLRERPDLLELELGLDDLDDAGALTALAAQITDGLDRGPVALRTPRNVRTGRDAEHSLAIARHVSTGLVRVTHTVLEHASPAYLVAKGGITSSDIATDALGMSRADVVGTMLPGIVSVWRAVDGRQPDLPYVVFAGNVGTDHDLAHVVDRWETAVARSSGAS